MFFLLGIDWYSPFIDFLMKCTLVSVHVVAQGDVNCRKRKGTPAVAPTYWLSDSPLPQCQNHRGTPLLMSSIASSVPLVPRSTSLDSKLPCDWSGLQIPVEYPRFFFFVIKGCNNADADLPLIFVYFSAIFLLSYLIVPISLPALIIKINSNHLSFLEPLSSLQLRVVSSYRQRRHDDVGA